MTSDQINQFEHWSMIIGVWGLILYMAFIMYRMAKDSKAGRLGTFAIFLALGFGLLGFVAKEIIIEFLHL